MEFLVTLLVENFQLYYGMDWLSFIFGLLGMWLLGKKHSMGFLLTAISIFLAGIVAVIAYQVGFLVANFIQFFVALKGYYNWKKEPIE